MGLTEAAFSLGAPGVRRDLYLSSGRGWLFLWVVEAQLLLLRGMEQGRGFLAHLSSSEEASLKKVLGPPPVRGQAKGPGRSIYTIALMR